MIRRRRWLPGGAGAAVLLLLFDRNDLGQGAGERLWARISLHG